MGMSIDIHVLDVHKLAKVLVEKTKFDENKMQPLVLLETIGPKFGIFLKQPESVTKLLVLQLADAWDDYDPYFGFIDFLDRYYGVESYELIQEAQVARRGEGADPDEVADELGIKLPEKEEE